MGCLDGEAVTDSPSRALFGQGSPYIGEGLRPWLLHTELVPLGVRHHHPLAARLLHLPQHRRSQPLQPGDLVRTPLSSRVQVEMEPVLYGLRLRYALEEQPSPEPGPALLLVRIIRMPYGDQIPKGPVTVGLDGELGRYGTEAQQLFDERAVVLHLVAEGGGPEVRLCVRVFRVDDELPVQGRVSHGNH